MPNDESEVVTAEKGRINGKDSSKVFLVRELNLPQPPMQFQVV